MNSNELVLRGLKIEDAKIICEAFKSQGWDKPIAQYHNYFEYQTQGRRDVLVAELSGDFVGYLTIAWESEYDFFKYQGIPEIIDFNVLKKYQRKGIGNKLMDEAEYRIKQISKYAGIGFGMTKDYGPAQILYINRGYKPDGNGLMKDLRPVEYGGKIVIDDGLVLYMLKKL